MITLERTRIFVKWFAGLKDLRAKDKISFRIARAGEGNFGDCAPVGDGVSEMRIHHGPGYRVYFTRRGETLYLLLAGGDKSTQQEDIARAKALAKAIEDQEKGNRT